MKAILIFLFFSLEVFSSPSELRPSMEGVNYDELKKNLLKIKNLKPDEYVTKIDKYRGSIERFVGYKKRVCNGEFSSLVLKGEETLKGQKKRLSKEEKALCLRELKSMQRDFIDNIFQARIKYLDFLHKSQVKELHQAKADLIKSLDKNFQRKFLRSSSRP